MEQGKAETISVCLIRENNHILKLVRLDAETTELEEIKDALHMFKMRNKVRARDKDVIHIQKTVWKSLEDFIHYL